ncbi:MAG: hypothetical protein AAF555_08985 [Verrucomicrobiota bacterium]
MDIQIATLCDSAADYQGKLCILGSFDTLAAPQTPVVHPQCALAIRICFLPEDEGHHKFRIRFVNADGQGVTPAIEPDIDVSLPDNTYYLTRNLVINLQQLKFEQAGQYSVEIASNDTILKQLPLRVVQVNR